jgi:ABC-type Mn2+/Zn2+ transport system ATPase subunit
MNQLPLISLDSAAFGYVSGGQPIISDCTFTISKGEYAVLRGPNGCGKSTVIKGILGLALILKGKLQWNIGRKDAGYVPQESSISSTLPFTA